MDFGIGGPAIRSGPEVLGLYRKREGARRMQEHGVFARFRYNDLKGAGRDCGGRGRYANSIVGRSGVAEAVRQGATPGRMSPEAGCCEKGS
jgi:hypothetical protein